MTDARNIALTADATAAADAVKAALGLESTTDAARVGLAYALRHELSAEREGQAPTGSNFNVATIDTDQGDLRELVKIFYGDDEVQENPYRAIEALMSKGLVLLARHLDDGTIGSVGDLVSAGTAKQAK